MHGKRKSGVFFCRQPRVQSQLLGNFIMPERTWSNHNIHIWYSNIQVTIFVTCLNFARTGSQILLPAVSSCRRVILSRKMALNSNGEVNYRELARRPWTVTCTVVNTGTTSNYIFMVPLPYQYHSFMLILPSLSNCYKVHINAMGNFK